MSLDGALSVASGGLANINRHLSVVSQNVANVGTTGYARQVLPQTSIAADGQGMGVRVGVAEREIDLHLQSAALAQNGVVAELTARQTALARIDAVHGTPGLDGDLAALVGKLADSFTALAADPASQPRQSGVVGAARGLAEQINALDASYNSARQAAHDGIVADVETLNTALAELGDTSARIVQLRSMGKSTADVENQRDAAKATVSRLLDVRYLEQASGALLVNTPTGLSLPTRFDTPPFSVTAAAFGPDSYYPGGGVPAITLRGTDVTTRLGAGSLQAGVTMRDTTLPVFQAELDEFAITLSSRFEAQGLRLFSDPNGVVPSTAGVPVQSAYVGYAGIVGVNPLVVATPSLVRDGTHSVAGSPTGATAFTPNPAGGPAGFADLVSRILAFTFGTEAQAGVTHPPAAQNGLGPSGGLAAAYPSPPDLLRLARALVTAQADESARIGTSLDAAEALKGALDEKLSASTAVSIDQEMTIMLQLQSAYAANARVISAVQTMMDQTLQMLR